MAKEKGGAVGASRHISWSYREGKKTEGVPWGPHKLPLSLDMAGVSIVIEKNEHGFLYRRNSAGDSVEKAIMGDNGSFFFSPVEPLHVPAGISTQLLVEFDRPVVVEPRASKEILVTFPLELACVIDRRRAGKHVLDIFSFCRSKFTLYGNVRNGLVCKYWKSAVYASMPPVNPLEKGILKIEIQNSLGRWIEVHRAVLSAFGMKIYYSPDLVSLNAAIKINSELNAETNFTDRPLQPGMLKALEQFSSKPLSQQGRTVMEEGY